MRMRRAFCSWQFPAAILIPLWILIGYGFFGGSSGWTLLGLVIALPILALCLAVVASLVVFRITVRPTRTPGWSDVVVVGAWQLSLVAFGFFPPGAWALGIVSVALGLVAFWHSVWRFLADARATLLSFTVRAQGVSSPVVGKGINPERPQDGQTIVL
ncbi:hypothetical protein [Rathayibacter toxicus]|nr:hypothetical protein [Rathayibacter toxicus]ALS56516.1 hypothetical protein APU90_00850 [Rathayibacter toxicus]PPG46621.1 hypothetical protein C5D16_05395 [Rathayibacter toxicus]PPH23703.1 hypothetical protein C5D17_05425 [Rathayibacter toxicus]PPH60008.1 hypothetical protein C5C93_05475 [Rathayibacter toxicus]PPH63505.1 hypothetical protein C5D13_05490 [Rathayibacter toxicus]